MSKDGGTRRRRGALLAGAAGAGLLGPLAGHAAAELVYGVTWNGFLVSWDSQSPGAILGGSAITGLAVNESIVAIDFRPSTGTLYGLGSQGMLYTINPATAQVSQAVAGGMAMPLMGSAFGFDFDPGSDMLRVVSNADQNMLVDASTGSGTEQGMLAYPMGDPGFTFDPNVVHLAFAGTPTALYGIDVGRDTLVRLANPATGQLQTVATIPLDMTENGGFDYSMGSGSAYAATLAASQSQSRFVRINVATGAVTDQGVIGGGNIVVAIAVVPAPASALLGLATLTAGVLRRRR